MQRIILYLIVIVLALIIVDHVAFGAANTERDIDLLLMRSRSTAASTPVSGKVRVYPKTDNKLYVLDSSGTESIVGSGSQSLADVLIVGNSAGANSIDMNNNSVENVQLINFKKQAGSVVPSSGFLNIYAKADDKVYKVSDSGVETELGAGAGGGSSDAVTKEITQASHGFSIGDVIYFNGSSWAKAQANADSTSEVLGVVSEVPGASDFTVTQLGFVSGLSGLTAGSTYFLSPDTAGGATPVEPTAAGQISKPVYVATATTDAFVIHSRGAVIESQSSGQLGSWTAYTPTLSAGFGTATGVSFQFKTVGDTLHVKGSFTNGTAAASLGTISLPAGFTIDTAKMHINATNVSVCEWIGRAKGNAANNNFDIVACTSSDTGAVYLGRSDNTASHLVPANVNNEQASSTQYQWAFSVPIN